MNIVPVIIDPLYKKGLISTTEIASDNDRISSTSSFIIGFVMDNIFLKLFDTRSKNPVLRTNTVREKNKYPPPMKNEVLMRESRVI